MTNIRRISRFLTKRNLSSIYSPVRTREMEEELKHIIKISGKWRQVKKSSNIKSPFTVYTDASCTGYGAVICNKGQMQYTFSGQWQKSHTSGDMPVLEAKAIITTLAAYGKRLVHSTLFTDSNSFVTAFKRGGAKNFYINRAIIWAKNSN